MAYKKVLNKQIKNQVYKYLSFIRRNGIKIDKAIVFGSWAKGNPKSYSDIDLCLVSDQFKGDTFSKSAKLSLLAHKLGLFIEPHLYYTSDLKQKYDPLAAEIRKYGVVVS